MININTAILVVNIRNFNCISNIGQYRAILANIGQYYMVNIVSGTSKSNML